MEPRNRYNANREPPKPEYITINTRSWSEVTVWLNENTPEYELHESGIRMGVNGDGVLFWWGVMWRR